jgi:hypothetical protein
MFFSVMLAPTMKYCSKLTYVFFTQTCLKKITLNVAKQKKTKKKKQKKKTR